MSVSMGTVSLFNNTSYNEGQFVAKVSKTKTRSKDGKDYYVHKITIPNQIADELKFKNEDYIFVKSSSKAKWYHLFNWNAEPQAWSLLPTKLQWEIQSSGMNISLPSTRVLEFNVESGGITFGEFGFDTSQSLTPVVSKSGVTNASGNSGQNRILTSNFTS